MEFSIKSNSYKPNEKIKRITIPMDDDHILFISTNNEPKKEGGYGKLAGMGEIMSIVDFINKNEKWSKLVSQEVKQLADEVFILIKSKLFTLG